MEHYKAIGSRLNNEIHRLNNSTSDEERQMREVWVQGVRKELDSEKSFLIKRGIFIVPVDTLDFLSVTDNELLKELIGDE